MTRDASHMENFSVGDWVIALEPSTIETHLATNFDGETAIAQAVRDRSLCDSPHEIVAVDLPFVMLEFGYTNAHGKKARAAVNLREWKLKKCEKAFVEAWRATLP